MHRASFFKRESSGTNDIELFQQHYKALRTHRIELCGAVLASCLLTRGKCLLLK